jgi:predicted Zn-dependent protease with MMP-like domain
MITVSDETFSELIGQSFAELPREHMAAVKNVAIVYADEPTPAQRQQLQLRNDQTLFGLYEGVPLARRQGMTSFAPDKITLFKLPLCSAADTILQLKAQIKHTLWHEIAHYFGLDHPAISKLERKDSHH